MKIAFTGSSSTGKTTLAGRLMAVPEFAQHACVFIREDARELLRTLGHRSMDNMSRDELRVFQQSYFGQKLRNEASLDHFLVDRSFLDVAAYWLVRDAFDLEPAERDPLVSACRTAAARYDLHIYFPMDQIPFASDGYRSENIDFHKDVDSAILALARDWGINPEVIASADLEERVRQVLEAVNGSQLRSAWSEEKTS